MDSNTSIADAIREERLRRRQQKQQQQQQTSVKSDQHTTPDLWSEETPRGARQVSTMSDSPAPLPSFAPESSPGEAVSPGYITTTTPTPARFGSTRLSKFIEEFTPPFDVDRDGYGAGTRLRKNRASASTFKGYKPAFKSPTKRPSTPNLAQDQGSPIKQPKRPLGKNLDFGKSKKVVYDENSLNTVKVGNDVFDLVYPAPKMRAVSSPVIPDRRSSLVFKYSPAQEATKTQKSFLDFPDKVRAAILSQALIQQHDITMCTIVDCPCPRSKQPALAHVSRQIRQESLEIYYTQNKFQIQGPHYDHWLSALSPFTRSLLKNVELFTTNIAHTTTEMLNLGFVVNGYIPLTLGQTTIPIKLTFKAITRIPDNSSRSSSDVQGVSLPSHPLSPAASVSDLASISTSILDEGISENSGEIVLAGLGVFLRPGQPLTIRNGQGPQEESESLERLAERNQERLRRMRLTMDREKESRSMMD